MIVSKSVALFPTYISCFYQGLSNNVGCLLVYHALNQIIRNILIPNFNKIYFFYSANICLETKAAFIILRAKLHWSFISGWLICESSVCFSIPFSIELVRIMG